MRLTSVGPNIWQLSETLPGFTKISQSHFPIEWKNWNN